MPELPDIAVYIEALEREFLGREVTGVRVASVSVLRTFDPPHDAPVGLKVKGFRRIGKRIVFEFPDDLFLVIHLMVAGRLRLEPPGKAIPRKVGLAVIDFEHASLLLTEQGTKRRAGIWLLRGEEALLGEDRGGVEPLEVSAAEFKKAITAENRTLNRPQDLLGDRQRLFR
jgi:formamidopyrimidine-DNA glycosylase